MNHPAPEHTLFACPQCWAAVNDPDGREPDGLCQAGRDLYDAAAEWAGRAMDTGRWAAYDAAEDACRAHVVGALTGAGDGGILHGNSQTRRQPVVLETPSGCLSRDLSNQEAR